MGEKPNACGECGNCFGRQLTLKLHQRIHTGRNHTSVACVGKIFTSARTFTSISNSTMGTEGRAPSFCPERRCLFVFVLPPSACES
ncbi:Zinc finger protein 174 [Manis javanica]|nr:Zinc finger protein 174 [Manis javanica]